MTEVKMIKKEKVVTEKRYEEGDYFLYDGALFLVIELIPEELTDEAMDSYAYEENHGDFTEDVDIYKACFAVCVSCNTGRLGKIMAFNRKDLEKCIFLKNITITCGESV